MNTRRYAYAVLIIIAVYIVSCNTTLAQTIDEKFWIAKGGILHTISIDEESGLIFLGGNVSAIGPITGQCAPLDAATGAVIKGFPKIKGQIHAIVPDGLGGYYAGGYITKAGE